MRSPQSIARFYRIFARDRPDVLRISRNFFKFALAHKGEEGGAKQSTLGALRSGKGGSQRILVGLPRQESVASVADGQEIVEQFVADSLVRQVVR